MVCEVLVRSILAAAAGDRLSSAGGTSVSSGEVRRWFARPA